MRYVIGCLFLLCSISTAEAQCRGPNCARSRAPFGYVPFAPVVQQQQQAAPVEIETEPLRTDFSQSRIFTYNEGYDESKAAGVPLAVFVKTKPRLLQGIAVSHVETFPVSTTDQGGIVIGKWSGEKFYRIAVLPPQVNDSQISAAAMRTPAFRIKSSIPSN